MIPVGLSEADPNDVVPAATIDILRTVKWLVVENLRTARRWIKRCDRDIDIDSIQFSELNEHTPLSQVSALLDPLRRGLPVGVMSEAGCPGVADPGAALVEIAQREGLRVVPLVGPSSILLSLMASGFNGQKFSFHGYLPIDEKQKVRSLLSLERESASQGTTQIFIETPYRNNKMVKLLADTLRPDTLVCVAADVTDPRSESIRVLPARQWQKEIYDYAKRPAIFLISAPSVPQSSFINKPKKRR